MIWLKVFMFLYHFSWTLLSIPFLPLIPLTKNQRIVERFGLNLPADLPRGRSIWIHALSVGEVLSALPLVRALNQRYSERDVVLTVTTAHGMKVARDKLEGEVKAVLTMPLDFWWSIRRIVNCIRPSIFILVETDIWPGLISHLRKKGIKTLLINGRISPRTFRSYWRFRHFTRLIMDPIELCLMQSDLDRKRLLQTGIEYAKVKTVGNIKFDRDWKPLSEEEYHHWIKLLGIGPQEDIWVAGSTHLAEEPIILEVFGRLRRSFPTLRLIIAPRKVERSVDISRMVSGKGFESILRTELPANGRSYDVLILDTVGELDRIYGIGKVSFVGGSLTPVGGHNLLEPASFGQPVLFGPHTHNFVSMAQLLEEAGGGMRVADGEELFRAMNGLLADPEKSSRMGRYAKGFVEESTGALARVMERIGRYITRP